MPRAVPLSDDARYPGIPADRRDLLHRLRQHAHAPAWNLACGDRLDAAATAALGRWDASLRAGPPLWREGETPAWLGPWVERTVGSVPFYRERTSPGAVFSEIPTFRRKDLAHAPWAFVPEDHPLDDLLIYPTSGTTGPAFDVYSHPVASNAILPFLRFALERVHVQLEGGPGRVSLAAVHAQLGTYTYPSLMSWLDGAAYVKVNLHPSQWRDPTDPVAFLDDCAPEIYLGDPYAFAVLAELPLKTRPKALVSSATALSPGWRAHLERHFRAPVIDLYSLTEARLLAVSFGDGHEVLAPDLYVEVLDPEEDRPVVTGGRGEVVVSGGCNPLLPLLRYRTGDFARMEHTESRVILRDLEGRPPVCLVDACDQIVNTIDVSRALAPFALPRFQLHQDADRSLVLRLEISATPAVIGAVAGLFPDLPLRVEALTDGPNGKVLQYTSDVVPPQHPALFGAPP